MATCSTWLSLKDLSRISDMPTIDCLRTLQKKGWLNSNGTPTPSALEAGAAASTQGTNQVSNQSIWNAEICKKLLKKVVKKPIGRTVKIQQWTTLLEALEEGSASINATAEEMAEDLPCNLIREVNDQLALRGVTSFRVNEKLVA